MSFRHDRVLIVLPAFNEEESIAATLKEIRRTLGDIDCLVVNDGSADATASIAKQHGAMVASLPFNLGVGAAMRFGYRFARSHSYDVVVQLDADGQHDPAYLPKLVEQLDDTDLVIGARFAGEGTYSVTGPRWWAMKLLSSVLSRTAKTQLTDTTSGFRACGCRAINLFAVDYPAEYLGDTVESLVTAMRSGLKVRQVPVAMRPRSGGVPSQNPWRSTVFLVRALVALFFAYVRPSRTSVEITS